MLNDDQKLREKCLEIDSFIVQAPAGSGKTELLTQRFLKLLSITNTPSEILAVTFTNKAAAEMKNRIIGYLKKTHVPKNDLTKKLVDDVVNGLKYRNISLDELISEFNILTIDSLNQKIVNSMPLLSQFGFEFKIESDISPFINDIIKDVIYREQFSENIHSLLEILNIEYKALENYLAELMIKREFWIYDFFNTTEENVITNYLNDEKNNAILKIKNILNITIGLDLSIHEFSNLIDELYTKQKTIRKKIDLSNIDIENRERIEKLIKNNSIPTYDSIEKELILFKIYQDNDFKLIKILTPLLKTLCAELKVYFLNHKTIDFSEISQQALFALYHDNEYTDISHYLSIKYSHLLIDEFQDINNNQLKLFTHLIHNWDAENTIFCVGDPMQSIYRFRKSEVSIFLNTIQHGIGNFKLHHIILSLNNRSKPQLINWFNRVFSKIFEKETDLDTGEISYQSCFSRENSTKGEVNLIPYYSNKELSDIYAEAELVAQQILHSPHRSIAIIARSRTHLKPIVTYIKKHYLNKINITAIELEPLGNHQCIQDILSLTLALNNFCDRIHWVSLLQSPLCGLTIKDLAILFKDNKEIPWTIINSPIVNKISTDGQVRLNVFISILKKYLKKIYIDQWHFLIKELWFELKGAETLYKKNDYGLIEEYLKLIRKFESNIINDELLVYEIDNKMISNISTENKTVNFLTIHKSKGLEFDHVIIPSLDKSTRISSSPLINFDYFTKQNKVIFSIKNNHDNTLSLHDYHNLKNKIKDTNELKRLFYVAATRSISQLDLIAYLEPDAAKIKKNTFLELLQEEFLSKQSKFIKSKSINFDYKSFKPVHYQIPIEHLIAAPETNNRNNNDFYESDLKKDDSPEILIGIFVHKYLELIHRHTNLDIDIFIEKVIYQQNLPEFVDIDYLKAEVKFCIDNLHNTNTGAFIIQMYDDDHSEFKVSHYHEGELWNYRIDRTFLKNNERWIIDYKYHKNDNDDLNITALKYQQQLNLYAKFFNEKKIKKAVYFLRQSKLVEI